MTELKDDEYTFDDLSELYDSTVQELPPAPLGFGGRSQQPAAPILNTNEIDKLLQAIGDEGPSPNNYDWGVSYQQAAPRYEPRPLERQGHANFDDVEDRLTSVADCLIDLENSMATVDDTTVGTKQVIEDMQSQIGTMWETMATTQSTVNTVLEKQIEILGLLRVLQSRSRPTDEEVMRQIEAQVITATTPAPESTAVATKPPVGPAPLKSTVTGAEGDAYQGSPRNGPFR